jgi:hypothetical protein
MTTATAYSLPCVGIYTPASPLGGRDRTIVVLVVGGAKIKQVAAKLEMPERTVKFRVQRIARFLPGGGTSRDRLLLWAHVLLSLPQKTDGGH